MLALEWNLDDAKRAWQEEAREQAREQEREIVASKMLSKGKSFEEVHEFTDLPLQRIQELANDNRNS